MGEVNDFTHGPMAGAYPHSSLQGLAIPSKVYLEQLLSHWKPVYLGQLRASDRTPSRKLVKVEAIPQQQLHEAV